MAIRPSQSGIERVVLAATPHRGEARRRGGARNSPASYVESGASGADEGILLDHRSQLFVTIRYFLAPGCTRTLRTTTAGSGPRVVANWVANQTRSRPSTGRIEFQLQVPDEVHRSSRQGWNGLAECSFHRLYHSCPACESIVVLPSFESRTPRGKSEQGIQIGCRLLGPIPLLVLDCEDPDREKRQVRGGPPQSNHPGGVFARYPRDPAGRGADHLPKDRQNFAYLTLV